MMKSTKLGGPIRIIVLILLVYCIMIHFSLASQIQDKEIELASLTQKVSEQEQTNTILSGAIEDSDDEEQKKDIARQNFGLLEPDEKVFYITD